MPTLRQFFFVSMVRINPGVKPPIYRDVDVFVWSDNFDNALSLANLHCHRFHYPAVKVLEIVDVASIHDSIGGCFDNLKNV
jgi:hypothetical protein